MSLGATIRNRLLPRLEVVEIFPPLEEELAPFRAGFRGNVLNAGAGHRDIRHLIEGRLFNQDIPHGLHNANIDIYSPLDQIPVADGFFDAIICNAVLEHVEDPQAVLREFQRVCKPGGYLYLCIPFLQPEHKDPTDFQRYTLDGLCRLTETHGFEVVEAGGVHSVYTTLAWIIAEWLNSRRSWSHDLLKLTLFPLLNRRARQSRHHVHSLASSYRVLARRTNAPSPPSWIATIHSRYPLYHRPAHAYGMTTNEELCFAETFARDVFTGSGKIVDLGCWFGATTIALARGLQHNSRAKNHRRIEAFDLFRWEDWMIPLARQWPLPRHLRPGDSFAKHVRELFTDWSTSVCVHEQDLLTYTAPPEPVEFLFVDAMKSWALADKITHEFFPLLIPGTSVVVQQDFVFQHPIVATNHLIMWYLRDHFRWLHHVPRSSSVAFQCVKPITTLPHFTPALFTPAMVEEAYAYARQCVSPTQWPTLEAVRQMFLTEHQQASQSNGN